MGLSTGRETVITLTQRRGRACAKHNGVKSKVTKSVRNRPIRLSRERPDHERWVRFGAIVSGARGQTTSKHVRNRGSRSSRNKGRFRVSCSGGRASRDQREHRDRSCRQDLHFCEDETTPLDRVSTRAISVFGTQDLETEGAACQTLGSTGDEVRRANEEARNTIPTGRHSRTDVNLARHRRGALITPDRSRRGRSRRDRAGRGKSEARGRRSENTEGHRAGIFVNEAPEVHSPSGSGKETTGHGRGKGGPRKSRGRRNRKRTFRKLLKLANEPPRTKPKDSLVRGMHRPRTGSVATRGTEHNRCGRRWARDRSEGIREIPLPIRNRIRGVGSGESVLPILSAVRDENFFTGSDAAGDFDGRFPIGCSGPDKHWDVGHDESHWPKPPHHDKVRNQ